MYETHVRLTLLDKKTGTIMSLYYLLSNMYGTHPKLTLLDKNRKYYITL